MLLFIGIAATVEFARVGDGTPIPFDPPKRVVTSGPYAFTANPMQIISAFFMAILALYARSWGLAFVALMFAIFDTVYATWYNRVTYCERDAAAVVRLSHVGQPSGGSAGSHMSPARPR